MNEDTYMRRSNNRKQLKFCTRRVKAANLSKRDCETIPILCCKPVMAIVRVSISKVHYWRQNMNCSTYYIFMLHVLCFINFKSEWVYILLLLSWPAKISEGNDGCRDGAKFLSLQASSISPRWGGFRTRDPWLLCAIQNNFRTTPPPVD